MLLIFLVTSCADSWSNVKRGLTGAKQKSTDEFLVQKKDPLILPPDFDSLPSPSDRDEAIEEMSSFEKTLKKASETEKIVKSLKGNSGVYLVPAFTGLGAPYWNSNVRGVLCGLTRNTGSKEIVRAVIESVAYQSYDLFNAMKNDGLKPKLIKVDGGMVKNNWFSQFLSDVINIRVHRSKVEETTALGAAFMAGLKIGVFKSLKDISKKWKVDNKFRPKIQNTERLKLLNGWSQAIRKTLIH